MRVPTPMYTRRSFFSTAFGSVPVHRARQTPFAGAVSTTLGEGKAHFMIAFFVLLVVLMVLVVAAGTWNAGPRRRGPYARDVVVDRRPDVVEEVVYDDAYTPPVTRTRRVVRRRRTLG
ncbi:MAG TPA: hypothetical protein VMZ51_07340 [Acidimicrobiales bacterium]|nr:hypothetical protein [Acidimicrobiales bacterium]